MKIKISFNSNSNILLPVGYSKHIQALIYNHFDNDISSWLHDNGFTTDDKRFKLFVFSPVLERGDYYKENKMFSFPNKISFYVSSPVDWILEQLSVKFLKTTNNYLHKNKIEINSIEILKQKTINSDKILVKALSPVETHTTNYDNDIKSTYYHSPFEEKFGDLINENMKSKWKAFYKDDCPYNIKIKPLFNSNEYKKVVYFDNTVIEGWKGNFELEGEPEFLQFALDCGIGGRNSQGCGMIELIS